MINKYINEYNYNGCINIGFMSTRPFLDRHHQWLNYRIQLFGGIIIYVDKLRKMHINYKDKFIALKAGYRNNKIVTLIRNSTGKKKLYKILSRVAFN